MRSKKIIATLLLVTLTFSVVGCSDSNNTETKTTAGSEKATIETTSTEETSTAKESDSLIEESTSEVQTTTSSEETTSTAETETSNEEVSSAPNKISQYYREDERNIAVYPEYSFVLEYKDLIIETLNGKVFHASDVIDVKAELEKSCYSLEEYGKVLSFVYTVFCETCSNANIEAVECNYNGDSLLFDVDDSHNFVFKILNDCEVECWFEDEVYYIKVYSDIYKK